MQMGRWFGYRPRYADLCRVYTTPYLYAAFQEIALAMDDLRADLDQMAEAGKSVTMMALRLKRTEMALRQRLHTLKIHLRDNKKDLPG